MILLKQIDLQLLTGVRFGCCIERRGDNGYWTMWCHERAAVPADVGPGEYRLPRNPDVAAILRQNGAFCTSRGSGMDDVWEVLAVPAILKRIRELEDTVRLLQEKVDQET